MEIDIKELNSKLQIKKVNDLYFESEKGFYSINGFAFYIEGKGYLKFKCHNIVYCPAGGKKALQSAIDFGGFVHYDDVVFIQPKTIHEVFGKRQRI